MKVTLVIGYDKETRHSVVFSAWATENQAQNEATRLTETCRHNEILARFITSVCFWVETFEVKE